MITEIIMRIVKITATTVNEKRDKLYKRVCPFLVAYRVDQPGCFGDGFNMIRVGDDT